VYELPAKEKYIDIKIPVGAIDDGVVREVKSSGIRFYHDLKERPDRSGRGGPRYGDSQGRGERSGRGMGRPQQERRVKMENPRPEGIRPTQKSIMEAAGTTALQSAGSGQKPIRTAETSFPRSGTSFPKAETAIEGTIAKGSRKYARTKGLPTPPGKRGRYGKKSRIPMPSPSRNG
jgi:hypothetical protein